MQLRSETFALAQAGDPAALARLLKDLRPDIRRYAAHQCRRSSAIDDVVQEALIILYRRVGTIRSVHAMGSWLNRVVARLCVLPALMLLRGVDDLAVAEGMSRFARMPVDELRLDLVRALESLPATYREIVVLRDLQERTIGEIAGQLGLTREAAKSRLHRARVLMREYLAPHAMP